MEPRDLSLNPEEKGAGEETLKVAETVEVNAPEAAEMEQKVETSVEAVAETAVDAEAVAATPAEAAPATKEDVLAAARALAEKDAAEITNDDMSRLKQQYYALHNEELRVAREAFVAAGGVAEEFAPVPDPTEEQLKDLLTAIKEKKAAYRAALEEKQQQNLARKEAIIAKIKAMGEDTDNVHRHFQEVKELQAEFKAIGEVDDAHTAPIWKQFNDAVEFYYDQHKINKELRDYDFKKNLAEKELLCDQAEKLADEEDVITAFKRLQELHDKWRLIGPVAKDIREALWMRFKDASTIINKKYQTYFEERKARERANEEAKIAICERVEALDFSNLNSYASWDAMTETILEAQKEWRTIGYASKKLNNQLFARFRAVCDKFFTSKVDFFKQMKDTQAENLARKTALCERAEALKDSTEWRKATDELVALQKEWKTIGAVAKKQSDAIWRRFLAACDHFFEQKKKATGGRRSAEQENLKQKLEIIETLKNIPDGTPTDEAAATLRDAQSRWQQIGHVPFHEKDRVYEGYREAVAAVTDKFDLRRNRARMASFKDSVERMAEGDDNKLYRERDKLVRAYEQRKAELVTYQNNLSFFNSRSKSGDSLVKEMERKMEHLKEEIETLRKKIELVDAKL
ncbi:MAG: DUF349 domain-containing protein [Muribaculaceae bacterium]|nr:DUF349 domain-containing protein [Muribaculaceae bacterium]